MLADGAAVVLAVDASDSDALACLRVIVTATSPPWTTRRIGPIHRRTIGSALMAAGVVVATRFEGRGERPFSQ